MNEKKADTKIIRNTRVKNLTLVTGLGRSGKTMLAPIVSSLDRVENVSLNYLMEQIPMMRILGAISEEAAVYLMKFAIDFILYDISIGRNANFRYGDYSSIWRTKDPGLYIKRLFAKEGDRVFKRIKTANPIFLLLVHNALWHANVYFKAFPGLKMIHINRHPIDIVYSWYSKGYGRNFFNKPRNATLTIKWKSKIIPYYAAGWEEEYTRMSEGDRAIQMIYNLESLHQQIYKSLSEENHKRIKIISFEEMVTRPKLTLKEICRFLKTTETSYTPVACERERCPRKLLKKDQEKKLKEIRKISSNKAFGLLMSMAEEYEGNKV